MRLAISAIRRVPRVSRTAVRARRRGLSSAAVDDAPTAEMIGELQQSYREDPSAAQAQFRSASRLTSGLRSTASIRDKFEVSADEPKSLGGSDTAPNPVEILLASLATCQDITYKAYGQALGIPVDRVSVDATGAIDLRGFFAVDENVRAGFLRIDGKVSVDTSVPADTVAQLKGAVDAHCPVLDTLANPVPVTLELVTTNNGAAIQSDDAPSAADIGALQQSYRDDPSSAQVTFGSVSELKSGLRSTASIRDKFEVKADEPNSLGGSDTAPNPVEILLASLGTCQEITYKAYGQALGIPINSVSVDVTGDIDLRGFFAVRDDVRPGFSAIKGTVTIDSPAPEDALRQLKGAVDAHCPVLDMLQNETPVELVLS